MRQPLSPFKKRITILLSLIFSFLLKVAFVLREMRQLLQFRVGIRAPKVSFSQKLFFKGFEILVHFFITPKPAQGFHPT